jgi:hypothetical protein
VVIVVVDDPGLTETYPWDDVVLPTTYVELIDDPDKTPDWVLRL